MGAAKTDPPSGAEISDFEGTVNATTLTCNITNDQTGAQEITQWSIGNFRGVPAVRTILADLAPELFLLSGDLIINNDPRFTFLNRLTILNLTSELDEVIVYCGTGAGAAAEQANFTLRVLNYCKQILT